MHRSRLICLILVLATVLAYLPVTRYSFINYDDGDYVSQNNMVQAGLTWTGIKWAFTTFHAGNWHPLTWISLMLDCQLFGLNPGGDHVLNALLHAANVALLFLLLLEMTGALWPAAFVAALFALHPLHVESVAWISERKDVLSAFFGLLALRSYFRYAKENGQRSYWLTVLFFVCSLMSKPMLVTLPFVFLLLDYWPLGRLAGAPSGTISSKPIQFPHLALEKLPFFLLLVPACILTVWAQSQAAIISLVHLPLELRIENAIVSYARYLLKMVWPTHLSVIYPLRAQLPFLEVLSAALVLAGISWFVWRRKRENPYMLVGWLWYLGTLVPVIGLVQVGTQAMADRYSYIPLVGIFIAVAFGTKELIRRFQLGVVPPAVAAGLVLAGCLAITEAQLSYWRDSKSLFAHAVAVTKDNVVAQINLGGVFEQEGNYAAALVHYRDALEISPKRADVHNNLANLYADMGKTNEALAEYTEAVRLNPYAPLAYANYGTLLAQMGHYQKAMQEYAEAAKLDPNDSRPHYLMGKMLLMQGRSAEAVGHFRDALRLDPNNVSAIIYLARVLASAQNPLVRNGTEAVALAQRANALTGGEQPFVLDTLAMAYAEAGQFNEAQETLRAAIALATTIGDTNAISIMQQRLQLYQSGRPYREATTNATPEQRFQLQTMQ